GSTGTSTPQGRVFLAVSATDDPTGAWDTWALSTFSYVQTSPSLAASDDKVVIASNQFGRYTGAFYAAFIKAFRKNDLPAGAPSPASASSGPDIQHYALQPAQALSSGADLFLVATDPSNTNTLYLWRVMGEPGVVTVTSTLDGFAIKPLDIPPGAPQAG